MPRVGYGGDRSGAGRSQRTEGTGYVDEGVTNRLTGEEAPEDVPREAVERAREAEQRISEQHTEGDPENQEISES